MHFWGCTRSVAVQFDLKGQDTTNCVTSSLVFARLLSGEVVSVLLILFPKLIQTIPRLNPPLSSHVFSPGVLCSAVWAFQAGDPWGEAIL